MFRARSTPCYYAQRASAALIISEATQVSMQGQGYAWTPGIYSREQVEVWRLVTEAVHRAGARLWNPDDPSTYYGGGAKGIYRLPDPCPGTR